jgi:site-specific recombinase XerD
MHTTWGHLKVAERTELTEYLNLWLETVALSSESRHTVNAYRKVLRPFLDYLEAQGVSSIHAIQPAHIRAYLLRRKAQGISQYTLAKDYRHLHAFMNWLVKEGFLETNPCAKVQRPKAPPKAKPIPTAEELEKLFRACEGTHWLRKRDRALLLTALDTGLRASELLSLTVADAQQECLTVRGKGGKQRAVFLSPQTRLALKHYLAACPFPLSESSPLWWGKAGALQLSGLCEAVERIGKRAGVKLSPHALRRCFAILCLRNGLDLERLRLLMGHSSYGVLQHYLPLAQADLQQAHREHSPVNALMKRGRR